MLGRKNRDQLKLFITGSLRQLVPDDHILARVDRVLDLSWLHAEVADLYCSDNGRPGIDPQAAVRLMLAGLLLGIVHDRRLMREAQVNLAIRWFVGDGLARHRGCCSDKARAAPQVRRHPGSSSMPVTTTSAAPVAAACGRMASRMLTDCRLTVPPSRIAQPARCAPAASVQP
jgi:hypothetical protein